MLCSDNSAQHVTTAASSGASVLAVIPFPPSPSSPSQSSSTRLDHLWTTYTASLTDKWSLDPTQSLASRTNNSTLNFTVATKYYNALVSAVRLDTHPSYHFTDTINAAEAICVLLDTPLVDTSSTSPLHDLLKDLPDVECKLIVSMGTDGEHESDWELGHLAMDHGFELIHWKATEGEDRWDRVGVERMVEALEATMWQSMRVLGRGSSGVRGDDTDEGSEIDESDDLDVLAHASEPPQRPAGATLRDSNMQTDGQGVDSSDEEGADFGDYVRAISPTDDDPALATPFSAFLGGGSRDKGNDDGVEEADLEGLFAEFARMRDIDAGANDKQRRVIAEQAAMSLWRAFGLSDEED